MANEPTSMADVEFELSELDMLFNAYLDGELSDEEREEFDDRLESDPDFAHAWENFASVMGGLRGMPFEFAPDDFVDKVKGRIRTRSAGRFFAEEYLFKTRMPYEVVALVMIIVMAAAYLFMGAPPDKQMQDVNMPEPPPKLEP
jgi:anti-sigma factor RsiW